MRTSKTRFSEDSESNEDIEDYIKRGVDFVRGPSKFQRAMRIVEEGTKDYNVVEVGTTTNGKYFTRDEGYRGGIRIYGNYIEIAHPPTFSKVLELVGDRRIEKIVLLEDYVILKKWKFIERETGESRK